MASSPTECSICGGELRLLHAGRDGVPDVADLSPTNHDAGTCGDLWRCVECGVVHQPALPDGERLRGLYREMRDDDYLDEEPGRRETARRLLDLVAPHAPGGRLLDVGCGHGLLLDEARKRGYDVLGVELSQQAASHARERLGLEVRECGLEDLSPTADGPFDVIVLADVLEHVDDVRGAIARCHELLAVGGALLVATPDPASFAARTAGARWWGFVPAHTYLVPRRTLRELLTSSGLTISTDVAMVRTFSARYWVSGLAERGGPFAAISAVARRVPPSWKLSLSLGDERVIVSHRVEPVAAPEPLLRNRRREVSVHVVLPAYNAQLTIPAVASEMPRDAGDRALLVDDASGDATTETALQEGFDVLRHPANRGYGANQMTSYTRALLDGADIVVMVHADNQYDPALVKQIVAPIEAGEADVVIGSRLLDDQTIAGGMPRWKWVGNRFLTEVENRAFGVRYSEYHTGYRAFSADVLRSIAFLRNSDGFVFDQEIIAQLVARGARVAEVPIPTRYFLEASSVSFWASVEYGLRTLGVLARYRRDLRREDWTLLRRPAAKLDRNFAPDRIVS